MHALLSLLTVSALAAAASAQATSTIDANKLVDALLTRLSGHELVTSLPDMQVEGEVKLLFWKTPVDIEADDGAPLGNVTLKRFGDANLHNDDDGNVVLEVEVGVDGAELTYEYKSQLTKLHGVGPSGHFNAKVGPTAMMATIALYLDSTGCLVSINGLYVTRKGEIALEKGSSLVANAVYRQLLINMLEQKRKDVLAKIIAFAFSRVGFECSTVLPFLLAAPSA